MDFRKETDTMGAILVPKDAYYGAQTQRAVENFPISGLHFPQLFIHSLALVKRCAAMVNSRLGLLDRALAKSIVLASEEVMAGKLSDQFVLDIFQTGSGTSTNMNMNEVISSRANEILTGKKGGKKPVHPNDHVNLCQSSNDVIPSVIHITALQLIINKLLPALNVLEASLAEKAVQFINIKKIGRTHLQDAVPMTLGQEFSGYVRQIELGRLGIESMEAPLQELALGGTAVGNGLNAHAEFAAGVIKKISRETRLNFQEAKNHFQAQAGQDAAVATSGCLKTIAVSLVKIANDIRWLASGPRCGIGEIYIPSLQPGSSIMPGKVNPVIPEAVLQVAAQVIGNDTTIMMGGQAGNFELNVMLPVIAHNLIESIQLIASVSTVFAEKCIKGISINRDQSSLYLKRSLALATSLIPHIGYDRAAAISKKAYDTGKTIPEIVLEEKILPQAMAKDLFKDFI